MFISKQLKKGDGKITEIIRPCSFPKEYVEKERRENNLKRQSLNETASLKSKPINSFECPTSEKLIFENGMVKNMMPTYFEPKTLNRWVAEITDQNGNIIIPHYVICKIDMPSFYYNWYGRKVMNPLNAIIYDPIVPNSYNSICDAVSRKMNINLKLLGPVGDIIQEFNMNNSILTSVRCPQLDWSNGGDFIALHLTFKIKTFIERNINNSKMK